MVQIQQYMEKPDLPWDFGMQIYEQRIVELEKRGEGVAVRVWQCRAAGTGCDCGVPWP